MELTYEVQELIVVIKTPSDDITMEELYQYMKQLCLAAGFTEDTVKEYFE